MIWKTKTAYADLETGEEIPKKKVTEGLYVIAKTVQFTTIKNNTYATKHIHYGCRRNNQTKLF